MKRFPPAKGSILTMREKRDDSTFYLIIKLALIFIAIYAMAKWTGRPYHFEYGGHSYIRFYQSTVHDPDCRNPEHQR